MRLLPVSATSNVPLASSAIPRGALNEAAAPVPSVLPRLPEPANVVTTPCELIRRMQWLSVSATNTLPTLSTTSPAGDEKAAAVPVALVKPAVPFPANVVTTPAVLTVQMRWLPVSARYKVLAWSMARPVGRRNCAVLGPPSALPSIPVPANVLTVYVTVGTDDAAGEADPDGCAVACPEGEELADATTPLGDVEGLLLPSGDGDVDAGVLGVGDAAVLGNADAPGLTSVPANPLGEGLFGCADFTPVGLVGAFVVLAG